MVFRLGSSLQVVLSKLSMSSSQVSTKSETDHCYSLNLEQLEWEMTKYKGPLPNSR